MIRTKLTKYCDLELIPHGTPTNPFFFLNKQIWNKRFNPSVRWSRVKVGTRQSRDRCAAYWPHALVRGCDSQRCAKIMLFNKMRGGASKQCVAVCYGCSVLQCVAVCCSVLPCVAVCCSVLQCVAMCCSVFAVCLQCVAVCCSVFERDAVRCKCVAVCGSVLQCVAVCTGAARLDSSIRWRRL